MIKVTLKGKIVLENFARMKYLSLVFIGFATFSLFIDYSSVSLWNEEHLHLYKLLDIVFAFISVFSLVFYWTYKGKNIQVKDVSVRIVAFLVLNWAAIITGIEFTTLGFSTYILVLISAVFFINFTISRSILIFLFSSLALTTTIYLSGQFTRDIYPFLVMLVPITVISVLLSGKNYLNKCKTLEQSEALEKLNYELRLAKQDLELKVEERTNELMLANAELKQKNEELYIAKHKAEESDRLKTHFLANMSHEIRTPMNAIVGFSDLLIDRELPPEKTNKFLRFINTGSKRLLVIISDIIDISKIDSNQINIKSKTCDLNKILSDLHEQFSISDINPEVKLLVKKGLGDDKCKVKTDEQRLVQILSNLLVNARKFTSKGSIEFGYKINNTVLEFFVKDTGIGIAKQDQPLIFERFGQIYNDDIIHEGTGLGLSIVKGLLDLMGGDIWVNSDIGKGSEFFFTIPYVKIEK